ncbi:MAG: 4-alpha-glucanotransferase [Pseudomonadota bacterium]
MSVDDALLALAAAKGIATAWYDIQGTRRQTTPDTAFCLLRAMGVIDDRQGAAAVLADLQADTGWRPPRAAVLGPGQTLELPEAAGRDWHLDLDRSSAAAAAPPLVEAIGPDGGLRITGLPLGLHTLTLAAGRLSIIVAPHSAPTVEQLTGRGRIWGVTGAVHALWRGGPVEAQPRGRYTDLGDAAAALAGHGAAFFGINPVHALGAAHEGRSPYSPGHRGFLDTRAIPVDGLPTADAAADLIDHEGDRRAHDRALRARFRVEMASDRGAAGVADWRAALGPDRAAALATFATFEALSSTHGPDWRRWPGELQAPDTDAVARFAADHGEEIAFHAWAQMTAEAALANAQQRALDAGMALGLYLDLAVGVRPDGAEVWARPGTFARGVSLGAPPDMFSPDGQAWGLAPFDPAGLAAHGYRAFVDTLQSAMRHAGMLRIDHVLGLERTFWVPDDGTPGGYVASDREALLALVRLEATRQRCLVIGEDLGVVPDGLRQRLAETHLYGCSVAMYERWEGRLRAPWHYSPGTLASFGTHDTPTLAGWWIGRDIDWRERIGHTDPETAADMRRERAGDRHVVMALLAEARLLPDDIDPGTPPADLDEAMIVAVHALLATTAAAIAAVQLDDALGTIEQANLPGTVEQHPNWRRRHATGTGQFAAHPALSRIAEAMASYDR